jgi:hypothetical protein
MRSELINLPQTRNPFNVCQTHTNLSLRMFNKIKKATPRSLVKMLPFASNISFILEKQQDLNQLLRKEKTNIIISYASTHICQIASLLSSAIICQISVPAATRKKNKSLSQKIHSVAHDFRHGF